MDSRLLEYFLITAREESISKAAEIIHISQPSLSRQIAEMENELHVRLFQRTSKGLALTEEGILLRKRAKESVEIVEKTQEELQESDHELEGKIVIGCGELNVMHEVADMIHKFQQKHPRVTFRIITANSNEIMDDMDKGLIDLGILLQPVNLTRYEYYSLKTVENWAAAMRADDPLCRKQTVCPEDLVERNLIFPGRAETTTELAHWFGPLYDSLHITITDNLAANNVVLIEKGMEIALGVEGPYLNLDPAKFQIRRLEPALQYKCVLAWKRGLPASRAARKMIEEINGEKEV